MTLKIEDLIGKGDGKTVLVDIAGNQYCLSGVVGESILLEKNGHAFIYSEEDLEDFKIKKPVKKYWQWVAKYPSRETIITATFYDENGYNTNDKQVDHELTLIRKIGKPIDQDGKELEE